MLIEFRAANFRSIREEQVLTLAASADKTLQDSNTVETGINAVPRLLLSTAVFGANASGKSNLVRALRYMQSVVVDSAATVRQGDVFNVQPFLLDKAFSDKPSEFEVSFLLSGIRYQYGFSMTRERIISEYLLVYKAFKPQTWFNRRYNEETGKDEYTFSSAFRGQRAVLQASTRQNALFLSTAVQLNHPGLRPVFDWFRTRLAVFNEEKKLDPQESIRMLEDADTRREILDFLESADISLKDIRVETLKTPGKNILANAAAGKISVTEQEELRKIVTFEHAAERGRAVFKLEDESAGTRILFFLAGPLLNILRNGAVLVIDELDTSLHPLLVQKLVRLFHNAKYNTGKAQLVFTTHDVTLLDAPELFRRDQIRLAEKDRDEATSVVSLAEFSPRKNEALMRGYLFGRYGAIPFLED